MDLSIVIPTYNESSNLAVLVQRISSALSAIAGIRHEIIFVDDSTDDTPEVLQKLSEEYREVIFFHRHNMRGLGSAVVEGFKQSSGKWLVVMDADLQHPPELLPDIVKKLEAGSEIVIPSRFVKGGSDGGLNLSRKLVSLTARRLAWLLVKPLRGISDSTSGYFGLLREVIEGTDLQPSSWKILMEILVKGQYSKVLEIPYHFEARRAEDSKMNFREQWNFLQHLLMMRFSK